MNVARAEKQLSFINYSYALSISARMYALNMAIRGETSHNFTTWDEKLKGIKTGLNTFKETWLQDYRNVKINECLAWLPTKRIYSSYLKLIYRIAHVFDDSPNHAAIVYNRDAIYAGWGIVEDFDGYWICLYVATENK
ncbi:hypothetical protein ES705_39114 [subsurface metagenome]